MPELPEVETVSRYLNEKLRNRAIDKILLCRSSVIKNDTAVFEKNLPGAKILKVFRRGKYIVFQTPHLVSLYFHLGMTGQLLWADAWDAKDRHLHFVMSFRGMKETLLFRDIRRFGKIFLTAAGADPAPKGYRGLGPEPLEISKDGFMALYKNKKGWIKSLLLKQELVAGIGNIYADESLFRAGIHPRRRPFRIPRERLAGLYGAVQNTLRAAIDHGGSTIDDFVHADGLQGAYQKFHRVYGKAGRPCFVCGEKIRKIVLGGRSSFFCPQCQK